jgi:hypothetical protein
MTKNWKKFTAEKKKKFLSKATIYLSLCLHKGCPSYRRSLQPSKENIQHLKHEIKKKKTFFVGHFALLDPVPDKDPLP